MAVNNVSGFGASAWIVGTRTFPSGFRVTRFPDDVNAWKVELIEPVGKEPLATGGIYTFMKAVSIDLHISVIPGTDDDRNLRYMLLQRLTQSKVIPLPDITIVVLTYPDGSLVTLEDGAIVDGPPAPSPGANGRMDSNTYQFSFSKIQVVDLGSAAGIIGTISQFL